MTVTSLKPGDRVESGTYFGPGGVRMANWVVANPLAGWGTIKSVSGKTLTVAPMMGQTKPLRALNVEQYSRVFLATGAEEHGSVIGLRVGDYLHYTGTANEPNPLTHDVFPLVIHQIKDMT